MPIQDKPVSALFCVCALANDANGFCANTLISDDLHEIHSRCEILSIYDKFIDTWLLALATDEIGAQCAGCIVQANAYLRCLLNFITNSYSICSGIWSDFYCHSTFHRTFFNTAWILSFIIRIDRIIICPWEIPSLQAHCSTI